MTTRAQQPVRGSGWSDRFSYDGSMRVRVLGPVGMWVDDCEVPVPAGKPRAILAMLALAGGRAVSAEQLVIGLWGEDPPPTAAKTLQVHVSTLRARLRDSDTTLVLTSSGYRLSIDPEAIDVATFERIADDGMVALGEGRADVASRLLRSALAEWTGEPLSNVLDSPFAAHEADRLALRRLAVVQARVEADLSLGLGATLVDELRAIADASPYDERACGQLMVALYRSGQPAAALAVFRAFRSTLGEELGLEVGPDLVELEHHVLMHDDSLLSAPAGAAARRTNLPQDVSRFIGREAETIALAENVRRSRLMTVAGVGGAGKTRLALTVAGSLLDEFADGVWFVELAPLSRPDLVTAAVAEVVGSRVDDGIEGIADFIDARPMLVVLDNCEHVIDSVASLAHTLLRRCPGLRIIATSREPLAIDGEQIYRVPPLALVDVDKADADEIRGCDAVRLLADRAALQRPGFAISDDDAAAAARICGRLDGMPLAIELAAARLRTLTMDDLAQRLDERFSVLTGSSRHTLARQQTLRALIDWSYDLLSPHEQEMLDRLSVFVGGFTVEAAEAISADAADLDALELLTALVDKSLVEVNDNDATRFRLLETIRQYATERLKTRDPGVVDGVRLTHARHYLLLAESAAPSLAQGPGQLHWLERLSLDHDNLRVAAITFELRGEVDEGLRLVNALHDYWDIRTHMVEGASTITAFLEHPSARQHSEEYVLALCHAIDMLERIGELGRADELVARAENLASDLGSVDTEVTVAVRSSMLATRHGRFEEALDLLRPFAEADLAPSQAIRLHMMWAYVCLYLDELVDARAALGRAAAVARDVGNERRLCAILSNLSCVDVAEGDLAAATTNLQEAQTLAARIGDSTTVLYILTNLGVVALQAGDLDRARISYRDGLLRGTNGSDVIPVFGCMLGLALCSTAKGDLATAAILHGVVETGYHGAETVLDPTETAMMREDRERLRDALGDTELTRLMEQGGGSASPRRSRSSERCMTRCRSPLPSAPPHGSRVVRAGIETGSALGSREMEGAAVEGAEHAAEHDAHERADDLVAGQPPRGALCDVDDDTDQHTDHRSDDGAPADPGQHAGVVGTCHRPACCPTELTRDNTRHG